jgi:hypothetical protein
LQEQLKNVVADRDRHAFEKLEIVERANAISRERDDFRQRLAAATAEHGELRQRLAAVAAESDRLAAEAAGAKRALAEAARRAEESAKEILGLRHAVETAPSADPADVLWALVRQKTTAGVAFLRSKIPENHPALGWFDKTLDIATQLGCLAVRVSIAIAQWARDWVWPRVKQLALRLTSEVEARLAKK